MPTTKPAVSPAFAAKKAIILASLSTPEDTYTDLSPKGSVDEAIVPLIERINQLDGVVTTSSCAGRVSVFCEGEKHKKEVSELGDDAGERSTVSSGDAQTSVPGGKGRGGRWLFVSHKPVETDALGSRTSLLELLGLPKASLSPISTTRSQNCANMRLVRFQFEPMILHIMCSSLHHATHIVAAAINAGFRESGVQSLKNLIDPHAFPMVAVRTSGLALESLIGYAYADGPGGEDRSASEDRLCSLVSEEYLRILLGIADERFNANTERMQRFERELFRNQMEGVKQWEAANERAARKKVEGLARRRELQNSHEGNDRNDGNFEDVVDLGILQMPSAYPRPSQSGGDVG